FTSGSDTEVILKAYLEWGEQSLQQFIGMFAFVIYDKTADKLFIARDRAGVKPLFYYFKDDNLLFASELKALFVHPSFKKEIDGQSVVDFLRYGNIPAPASIFQNTFKLEPGHYMTVDLKTKHITTNKYWNVLDYYSQDKLKISEAEATAELKQRLEKACAYRMVSDVPVGLFLSGGYDSSLVAALLQSQTSSRIKTFTIGFSDAAFNEAHYAKQVADHLGTDHHELYCSYDDAKSIIPELPDHYDEPFGDSSAIPTILVSRFARKSVTVALSADGGDELMAGYERHAALLGLATKVKKLQPFTRKILGGGIKYAPPFVLKMFGKGDNTSKENLGKYADFLKGKTDLVDLIDLANQTALPSEIQALLTGVTKTREVFDKTAIRKLPSAMDQLLAFDYISYLPNDILAKVDRATMSVSLEGREPLLDQNLIEWIARLPDTFKLNNGKTKYLFREIVHSYIPKSIMDRPKMGFAIPLTDWFRKDLRMIFETYLNDKALGRHGFFKPAEVAQLLDGYYRGENFRFPLLWNILMFQLWYEKWME
ncbi:MAG: asparagine synthase (glutamine-hydrolyzing), partial [Chitinophagaceae bacterium]|nr:asparagine synthase (glutamine-hydrolyzing) [Chitinophagaceae bacterium]